MVLVHILINSKKPSEAASHLNDFLVRNPKNQEAWYLLGKTYLQLSEDALKKINEIDPDSVVAHEIAGEIDASMHNYDLALVEYKKAVDLGPKTAGNPYAHGRCLSEYRQVAIGTGGIQGRISERSQ